MTLPPFPNWPSDALVLFHERWAIREFDGGMETEAARLAAIRDVEQRDQPTQSDLFIPANAPATLMR